MQLRLFEKKQRCDELEIILAVITFLLSVWFFGDREKPYVNMIMVILKKTK